MKFDKNDTIYKIKNKEITLNTTQIVENKFLLKYTHDGFYEYLERIFNLCSKKLIVNPTMSKKIIKSKISTN